MWRKLPGQLFSTLMVFWLCGGAAMADEELPLPEHKTVCSPSGVYCAELNPASQRTIIWKDGQEIWSMPGWFGDAYLADDGEHFVEGYWGYNLLALKAGPSTTMITFWRRGELVRRAPLSEIIADLSNLTRTASHYFWGYTMGIDKEGRFLVQTVEDRVLAFDVESGALVESRPHSRLDP